MWMGVQNKPGFATGDSSFVLIGTCYAVMTESQ